MSPNDAFAQSVGAAMSYLNSIGLDFEIIDDEADEWLILGYLETNIGLLRISTLIQRPSAQLIIYAYHSLVVLEPIRTKAADLVARANYGLSIGNFELDMDDGELRFKVNCQIPPGGVSAHNVGLALDAALGSLAHYHTAFVRCLYDGLSPKEAIEELEAEN